MRPDQPAAHHALYRDRITPASNQGSASLIAIFDTVIGPGATNTSSHRIVEFRQSWQRWRDIQNASTQLSKPLKRASLNSVACVNSAILYPMDYSRIR